MVHGDIRLELAAKATAFSQSCEVVSLGCRGLVAMSLEALGLRRFHYPFDDVRSSMDDVIRLVETDFANFPDSMTPDESAPVTRVRREDMSVLVDRFLGRRSEVPLGKPRLFVRAVNSSREVENAERLREALRRALPKARVYLLLLLDCQSTAGPVHFADTSDDPLFYRISERSRADRADRLECVRDMYGAAVTFALRFWSSCLHGEKESPSRVVSCGRTASCRNGAQRFRVCRRSGWCRQVHGTCSPLTTALWLV